MSYPYHICQLEKPEIRRHGNILQRGFRYLRNSLHFSERNALLSNYYPSRAAIEDELRRQSVTRYWYIIHPFSDFRIFWEIWMSLLYLTSLFIIPLECTNIYIAQLHRGLFINYGLVVITLHCLHLIDIICNFFTGYCEKNRKVIMEPNKIARNYVKGYFKIDFLSSVPAIFYAYFLYFVNQNIYGDLFLLLQILNLMKGLRILTIVKYTNRLAKRFSVNIYIHRIIRLLLYSVYLFHWSACIFLIMAVRHRVRKPEMYKPAKDITKVSILEVYFGFFIQVIGFVSIYGNIENVDTIPVAVKNVIFSLVRLCFCALLIVELLDLIEMKMGHKRKFNRIMGYMQKYMEISRNTKYNKENILKYLQYANRRGCITENYFWSIFPESLRKEISEFECKRVIHMVPHFRSLPEENIIELTKYMKKEIYVPGENIILVDSIANTMYFLYQGTVAVYNRDNVEVAHLYDGAYFGELELVTHTYHRTTSVKALEVCEIYSLDRDYMHLLIWTRELEQLVLSYAINKETEMYEYLTRLKDKQSE